jgi:hypothetical protein
MLTDCWLTLPAYTIASLLQMWVWMSFNHLKAIWKVLVSENAIFKRLFNFEIGFAVSPGSLPIA